MSEKKRGAGVPKICDKCGRELHFHMLNSYAQKNRLVMSSNLPSMSESGLKTVTLPIEDLKRYRYDYTELAEFVAWVCDVSVEKLCRSDMMRADGTWAEIVQNRVNEANYVSEESEESP